jgi:hypothetical protein
MKEMFFKTSICAIASAFMLTGCNNNEAEFNREEPVLNEGILSFVLPLGKKESATYANGVQGLDNEYAIDNLFIYWFVKDGANFKFQQVFTYVNGENNNTISLSNATVTATTPSTIANVAVGDATTQSHFYIVANVNLNGKPVQATALTTMGTGMLESAFALFVTDPLTQLNANIAPIVTPLPMAINASGTGTTGGFVNVQNPSTAGIVNVHLKRRVARFDIINNADYTGFRVDNIIISSARRRGWILDKPLGNDSWTTDANSKGSLIIDGQHANGTASAKVDANRDGIYDDFQLPSNDRDYRDSTERNRAIFYLWPTVLKQNIPTDPPLGSTEIVIEGTLDGGESRIYKLELPADAPIDANKIYKIKVFRAINNTISLNITVDDWDEEVDINTVGSNYIDWTKASFSSNKPSEDGTTVNLTQITDQTFAYSTSIKDAIDTVILTIVTKGVNRTAGATNAQKHTTAVRIVPRGTHHLFGDWAELTKPEHIQSTTIFSYGAAEYTTTHIIKLPPTNAVLETTLELINPILPNDLRRIKLTSLNYLKSALKPHLINGIDGTKTYWAPLNVGAAMLANKNDTGNELTNKAKVGKHFQWGRYDGWYPDETPTIITGPISHADINLHNKHFIITATNLSNWLAPWDVTLWSGANDRGPCPEGWRLPSAQEALGLLDNATINSYGNLYIEQNNVVVLCLPAAGERDGQVGMIPGVHYIGSGCYWTSESYNDPIIGSCNRFHFNVSNKQAESYCPSTQGESVRCVQSAAD